MLFVLFSINNNGTFVRGTKSKLRYIISSLPGFSFAAFKVIIVFLWLIAVVSGIVYTLLERFGGTHSFEVPETFLNAL